MQYSGTVNYVSNFLDGVIATFTCVYPNTDSIMYWPELGVVSLYYNLTA